MTFTRISHFIIVLMLALAVPATSLAAPDAKKIKREQQSARKAMEKDKRKLESNKREISKGMRQLATLQNEIGARDYEIEQLQSDVSQLDNGIARTHASIDSLANELETLRSQYIRAVRKFQTLPNSSSPLAYILSARSMKEAMQRVRYLKRFNLWRQKRQKEIAAAAAALGVRKDELARMQTERRTALSKLNENKATLKARQDETDRLVSKLKKESGSLQSAIEKRKVQLASLDTELNRIIEADRVKREKEKKAREQARKKQQANRGVKQKPAPTQGKKNTAPSESPRPAPAEQQADADRVLTGNFESNKGRLLFPVSGSYRIVRGFGKNRYSSKVQTSHVGVDIQVAQGTKARAIFEGIVTNVTALDGFNTIVVIRHGSYLSVYVNLSSCSMKAGQKVKAGQNIGTIAADPSGQGAVLQFGLRKERSELNPLQWVK